MILDQINERARSDPSRVAILHSDRALSYVSFTRSVEAARLYFESQKPPAGQTAVILTENWLDGWILLLAIRSLGLDTIVVYTLRQAEPIQIGNVACVVAMQAEETALAPNSPYLTGKKL